MIDGQEGGQLAVANIGYARVSTIDQDPALQLDALAAAGCVKVFEDRASGARADRAGLRSALDYVREGDVLIVWKLDRLGRSLPHLIETAGWTAHLPSVRRLGPVRARPHPGTHPCRSCGSRSARPKGRPQAGRHR